MDLDTRREMGRETGRETGGGQDGGGETDDLATRLRLVQRETRELHDEADLLRGELARLRRQLTQITSLTRHPRRRNTHP